MFKKKSFLSYIIYAVGEITLIVIGILLALYLQNNNDEKKNEKTVTAIINMLKNEISTNKKNIDRVKDYHIMVRDTINVIETPVKEEDVQKTIGFWRGMQTPRLQNAAFQTSIQSGVGKEFNPELLKALNALYTYQESYNNFTSQTSQIFFNADFSDIRQFNRIMASIGLFMNDLYYFESELNEMFEYNLKKIDSLYH
ncbi:MAG: hypothetical protein KDC74_03610 [Flavobacteriaceae bacterium]|nr:hypothetical protein [Flavobacteriaceae bacterium]MCB0485707.1 hypothetical protein [Flavobacteriaceae bacterium]